MRYLAAGLLLLCLFAPLSWTQTGFAGKLDRQRATFRHIRQGCGTAVNSTNFQTLAATARAADFAGGLGCPSFGSDNIRLTWTLPTSPVNAALPAGNATTVPLVAPAKDNISASIAGSGSYRDSTSESHSFFSRATLKEFTGGQCASAQKTVNNNLEGQGSVDLAVTSTCTLDQARFLTVVPGSVVTQNNQVTAFEAALTFEGVVDLAHGNQFGAPGWRGGVFTITVEAIYKFSASVDFGIDHIEIVQVTQHPDNSIPLVADKYTVARVFGKLVSSEAEPVKGIPMILRGFRNGMELPDSPIVNTINYVETWRNINRELVTHGFFLPDSWIAAGSLELLADINPDRAIDESSFSNNTASAMVTFNTKPAMSLRYLPVCIELPGLPKDCPSGLIGTYGDMIPQLFPVAESKLTYTPLPIPEQVYSRSLSDPTTASAFLAWVRRIYATAQAEGQIFDNLLAWIPDGFNPDYGGLGYLGRGANNGRASFNVEYLNSDHFNALTAAHELGHNYALDHTATTEPCDTSESPNSDWPYRDSAGIREVGVSGRTAQIYWPSRRRDIMSYCESLWISPFHYLKLYNGGVAPPATALKDSIRRATPADFWLLTGSVQRTGSQGTIDPFFTLRSMLDAPAAQSSGDFCLVLQAGSAPVANYCFTPSFSDPESGTPLDSDFYQFRVPVTPGVTRVSLQKQGAEIAFRAASANAPAVQWLSPSSTETWQDSSPRTLRWQASDADGAPLTYQLSYSPDNGLTWLPIALDLASTEYILNPARIEGGAMVRLRVRASDGFHTASAEVGPLTVQQRPAIATDPSPVDLGFATVGDRGDKSVTLRNSGSGYLRVESIASSNTRFRPLPNALPLLIAAGETFRIPIAYSPTTVGADTSTLTVRSNAAGQETFTFTIRASSVDGRQPRLETDLAALAFRPLLVGSSARATLSLHNPALVDLTASWSLQGQGFRLQGPSQATIAARAEAVLTVVFEPTAAGPFNGTLTLTSNDPNRPTLTIPIRGSAYTAPPQPQAPRINRGGVVDAAQFQPTLSPGGIASLFGSELASSVVSASTVPLPTSLNGVRVLIHGIPAPLFFIAPTQINFQVPFEVPAGATVEVIVDRDGVQSPVETARVNQFAPAVFVDPTTKDPIVTRFPDNAVISTANPARPGDVLILYLTGVGGLTSRPTTGQATPGSPLPESSLPATVTLGGQPVTVLYAGLSPFFIGLAQLNLQLPATLPPGAKLPLLIRFGSAESQPVQLPVFYDAPPAPVIQVSPASLNFGTVALGQSSQRSITIANTGTAPLSVTSVTLSNPRFTAATSLPVAIAPGATREFFVTFLPTTATAETGTLTLGSNDPATPRLTVALVGSGAAPVTPGGAPAMEITPLSLAFGDTAVGETRELPLTFRNSGTGPLLIQSITPTLPQFVITGASNAVIAAGAQQSFPVRFAPTAAGLLTGALTVASNDPARPAFTVPVTGTGVLTGAQTLVLQIDDGTFERTVSIPDATEAHWINRLTPPRYPATLKAIRIYFPSEGMVVGDTFTLLSSSHTGGAAGIGTPTFRTGNGRVPRTGEFVEFQVPELTIGSGDFLVGFTAPIAPGQRPMAVDISGYQSRSFVSLNGSLFNPIHIQSAASQGNFAIRAVVDVK